MLISALATIAFVPAPKRFAVLERFTFSQVHMGVPFVLTLYAADRQQAERAARAAFTRAKQLDEALSDYQKDSELNLLVRRSNGRPVSVSADLFRVLSAAQRVSQRSGGLFDVTLSPVIKLWRIARRTREFPPPSQLAKAMARVDYRQIALGSSQRAVSVPPGVEIDLGGIAKGYAVEECVRACRKQGAGAAQVEAGGDLALGDPPPGTPGWPVEIDGSGVRFSAARCVVSTSGSTQQFVEILGQRLSHIVDPRNGLGLSHLRQVTVVAKSGLVSDPWATIGCIEPAMLNGQPDILKVYVHPGES